MPCLPPAPVRAPIPSPFYGTTSSKPVTRGSSGREEQEPRSRLRVRRHHHTGRSFARLPAARPPARRSLLLSPALLSPSFSPLRCGCRLGCYGGCLRLFQQQRRRRRRPTANSHESAVRQPTSNSSSTSASVREGGEEGEMIMLTCRVRGTVGFPT